MTVAIMSYEIEQLRFAIWRVVMAKVKIKRYVIIHQTSCEGEPDRLEACERGRDKDALLERCSELACTKMKDNGIKTAVFVHNNDGAIVYNGNHAQYAYTVVEI